MVISWWFVLVALIAIAALVVACLVATGVLGKGGHPGHTGPQGPVGVQGFTGPTGTFDGILGIIEVNTGNSPFQLTTDQTNSVVLVDGSGSGGATVLLPISAPLGTYYYFSVVRGAGTNDVGFDAGTGNTVDFSAFTVPGASAATSVGQAVFLETTSSVDQTFTLALVQTSPANYWRVINSGPIASLS